MRTVLQFLAAYTAVCRRASDGIRDFATRSGWRLHVVPYANAADREDDRFGNMRDAMALDALLKEWRPDGCLIHWSLVWPDLAKSLRGIPCVTIDGADDLPAVCLDNAAIGRAAAKELLRLSPASLAYLSIHRPTYWCDERTAAFAATVRANGARAVDLGETGESVNSVSGRLVEALRRLPKPCGLFAVNDIVARRAAEAAEVAGLDIPCDLAIVGADDDELVCEGPGPTLSSVRPDFWGLGHEAAAMLDRLMGGGTHSVASAAHSKVRRSKVESPGVVGRTRSVASAASILRVGGETVVRRASSRRLLLGDPLVSATLEDIRLHYAEPITAASLARRHGVGLRTLELRFLRAKGRTIGREISDTRFHAAQDLLSAREWRSIEAIANFCGYDCDSTLRKAFSARLGLSPSAWRNAEKKR
jgi:LacI family transcriptional regulator